MRAVRVRRAEGACNKSLHYICEKAAAWSFVRSFNIRNGAQWRRGFRRFHSSPFFRPRRLMMVKYQMQ